MIVGNLKPKVFGMAFMISFHEAYLIPKFENTLKEALIDTKYYSKKRIDSNNLNKLQIRLTFDCTILNSVLRIIAENFQLIENDVAEFSGVELFTEYDTKAQILISNKNLIRLNELFRSSNIALNSITTDWSDKLEAHYQEVYYQIIICVKNNSYNLTKLRNEWVALLKLKYQNLISSDYISNDIGSYLYISLKEDIDKYLWNEQFEDILNLFESKPKELDASFGFYQRNRSDMNGGGVDYEIISNLISHKTDLVLSFGVSEFNNLKKAENIV